MKNLGPKRLKLPQGGDAFPHLTDAQVRAKKKAELRSQLLVNEDAGRLLREQLDQLLAEDAATDKSLDNLRGHRKRGE